MREIKLLAGEKLIRRDGTVTHGPGVISLDDFEPTYELATGPDLIRAIDDLDRRMQAAEHSHATLSADFIEKHILKDLRKNGPIARATKGI